MITATPDNLESIHISTLPFFLSHTTMPQELVEPEQVSH